MIKAEWLILIISLFNYRTKILTGHTPLFKIAEIEQQIYNGKVLIKANDVKLMIGIFEGDTFLTFLRTLDFTPNLNIGEKYIFINEINGILKIGNATLSNPTTLNITSQIPFENGIPIGMIFEVVNFLTFDINSQIIDCLGLFE